MYTDWEGRTKTAFYFTDDMIVCRKSESIKKKKLTELVIYYSKVSGYRLLNKSQLLFCMHAQSLSHAQLFATPWTVARQSPLFI